MGAVASQPALRAVDIQKRYATRADELTVLRGVSLDLSAGQSAAIMGPSGCGKSTLLSILGVLETPSDGELWIGNIAPHSLSTRDQARFRRDHIGFVFQENHLLPQLSVLENVLLPTIAGSDAGHGAIVRANELLKRVGLGERVTHRPAELSGGEKQRVALARALLLRPSLVLADEPTGALDRKSAAMVADLLSEMARIENAALLVVTHNDALARRFERRYELNDGVLEASRS